MKLLSGSRNRSVTYVIRPAVPQRDPLTGRQTGVSPALRAEFKEHKWDSNKAQQVHRWSDDERVMVEKYLLGHPDFGRGDGRGIFLDQTATLDPAVVEEHEQELKRAEARGAVPERRCMFMQDAGEDMVQCDATALEGKDHCERHEAMIVASMGATSDGG